MVDLTPMMTLCGAPEQTLLILLDDPDEHDIPSLERLIGDLSEMEALARPTGLPYSIAEIVAHMLSNARFNLGLIGHPEPESYARPQPEWPAVGPGEWDGVRQSYFRAVQELLETAQRPGVLDQVVFPANSHEPGWTVGYKLTCSVAKHAAYHMGQIAVIRRLLGLWRY